MNSNSNQFDEKSLFIGDLSCFCTETDIYHLFSIYGEIISIRLMRNSNTNTCLGYGFITFKDVASTLMAMRCNGHVFMGRKIRVSAALVRKPNKEKSGHHQVQKPFEDKDPSLRAQIHFSYFSEQTVNLVTEETIRNIFMEFGVVEDVSIKRTHNLPNSRVQHGYGFIRFRHDHNEVGAALQAVSVICHTTIDHVVYDCCLTRSFEASIYMPAKPEITTQKTFSLPQPGMMYYTPEYYHKLENDYSWLLN